MDLWVILQKICQIIKKTYKLNSNKAEVIYSIPDYVHYFKNNTRKEVFSFNLGKWNVFMNKPDTFILKNEKIKILTVVTVQN